MQRTMTTFSGALLAMLAAIAPKAHACSVPGIPSYKPAVTVPFGLLGSPRSAQPDGSINNSIVGLWHVTFYSSGMLADDAFDAWHSDGIEVLNDFTNPIEDNVCLGAWTQTGTSTYKLKHPSWTFDTSGNLTGVALIYEAVTLGSDGSSYSGTYAIYFYDTKGNPQGNFEGTLKAERITAD